MLRISFCGINSTFREGHKTLVMNLPGPLASSMQATAEGLGAVHGTISPLSAGTWSKVWDQVCRGSDSNQDLQNFPYEGGKEGEKERERDWESVHTEKGSLRPSSFPRTRRWGEVLVGRGIHEMGRWRERVSCLNGFCLPE